VGAWGGAPVRLHWTLPLGAFVFGHGRIAPGFWLGFFLLILLHEIGHALLVRRFGYRVTSIEVHGLGGLCRWQGDTTAMHRAQIAWGGVNAQILVFIVAVAATGVLGEPADPFTAQLTRAFTVTNGWLIALNLLPIPPLDGAEAWKLGALIRGRRRRAARRAGGNVRVAVERELAALDAAERRAPPPDVRTAVDAELQRIVGESKDKG
jgi:Zn-dependent protease